MTGPVKYPVDSDAADGREVKNVVAPVKKLPDVLEEIIPVLAEVGILRKSKENRIKTFDKTRRGINVVAGYVCPDILEIRLDQVRKTDMAHSPFSFASLFLPRCLISSR